jgi:uncharacterized membrane protein
MTPEGPTWEYLHLVAVPFTVVLVVAGTLVGLTGWASGREGLERWGVLSLALAGLMAVPSYFTGLTAADVAATRTFVKPSLVQTHRSWATWTTVLLVAQGVFAAFSLYQPDDTRLRRFVLALGLGGSALAGWSAFLGGKIVHGPQADRDRIEETVMGETGDAGTVARGSADFVLAAGASAPSGRTSIPPATAPSVPPAAAASPPAPAIPGAGGAGGGRRAPDTRSRHHDKEMYA